MVLPEYDLKTATRRGPTGETWTHIFPVEAGRGILPSPLVTYPKTGNVFVLFQYNIPDERTRDGTQHVGKTPHPETEEDDSDVSADDPLRGTRPRDVPAHHQRRATSAGNRLRNLECGSQPQTPAATQRATLDRVRERPAGSRQLRAPCRGMQRGGKAPEREACARRRRDAAACV